MALLRRTVMLALLAFCALSVLTPAQETAPGLPPSATPVASSSSALNGVRTIYVIPMKDRFEHFLTNELVKWGHFEVTLNPRQADALLSDTTEVDIKNLMTTEDKIRKTTARTRGTAFLIDLKTERVLWSAAKNPSESIFLGGMKSTRELAEEIVGQLKKDMQTKGQ